MKEIVFKRQKVLETLYEITTGISANRFVTSRPNATGNKIEDFILIRLPQNIRQYGDGGQLTSGQLVCFAKDVEGTDAQGNAISGMENTFTLEKLQSGILELFADNGVLNTPVFTAWNPRLMHGGADGTGFHSLIIQFQLQIH